jgi:hypothetical protein
VDLAAVTNLEDLRRLFEACTDLGVLEARRAELLQAATLDTRRTELRSLGVIRVTGCQRRVQGIEGVSPLGGLIADPGPAAEPTCASLQGARLENAEGEYFGLIAAPAVGESIFNPDGSFGSASSPSSIWNQFGVGGQLRSDSPWNAFGRGLLITRNGNVLGHLTVNTTIEHWLHPLTLAAVCYSIDDRDDPNQ